MKLNSHNDGSRLLAVIPARGGSKGLPDKNIRPFAGLPLIAYTIRFAKLCPEIERCIVSTDSPNIADIARKYGADVPFMRPAELAQDDTPMEPVLKHALSVMEDLDRVKYDHLLLLEPTSPARLPDDIANAYLRLRDNPQANGIIGVSQPDFNPIWVCVTENEGWMTYLLENGPDYARRQDVPLVYRINGVLYIWQTDFIRRHPDSWQHHGRHLIYEIPETRAISIDTLDEFTRAELLVKGGLVAFP
ncbi:MAG: acylneuraminate cytidylyltransferase family protein [Candidatus Poseidoniia archaeon]|jgi:N-acylneuraminate cytidylyltransferase|nr:acylneuraminate cytidylyltransferase family protein [Candidatus Poseidoniia archaeon]|tara:strand:- start:837 stop:1577 length:741 start_codon:yes stop_codon:yes gene_type:complete